MTTTHPPQFFGPLNVGSTPYYATLFLPKKQQETIRNLLSLWAELESTQKIPDLSVGLQKLSWWKTEISSSFDYSASHPLTIKLRGDLENYNLPEEYFSEIVDGFSMSDYFSHPTGEPDRDLYLQRTGGIPALLMAEVCGYQHRNTPKLVQILGSQLRLIYLLRTTPVQRANGLIFFTQEELSSHQLSVNDLSSPVTNTNLIELSEKLLSDTCEQMRATAKYLPPQDFISLTPLLSWINIEIALVAELRRENFQILEKHTDLTALRKLRITWRTRGQLKKGRLPV